jgi:hypothetical protein
MSSNNSPAGDAQNEPFGLASRPLRSVRSGSQPAPEDTGPADADDPPRARSDEDVPRVPLAQRIREQEGR